MVDLAAWRRGAVEGDEICTIAGFGDVPVEAPRRLLGEGGFLTLVLREGTRVHAVHRVGRRIPAALRSALVAEAVLADGEIRCAAPGCDRARVERDHVTPVAEGGATEMTNLQPLCVATTGSSPGPRPHCRRRNGATAPDRIPRMSGLRLGRWLVNRLVVAAQPATIARRGVHVGGFRREASHVRRWLTARRGPRRASASCPPRRRPFRSRNTSGSTRRSQSGAASSRPPGIPAVPAEPTAAGSTTAASTIRSLRRSTWPRCSTCSGRARWRRGRRRCPPIAQFDLGRL